MHVILPFSHRSTEGGLAPSQVRVSVPAVKAVFELGPIIVLNVSPTRYPVPARRIFWHFRSRPGPRFCLSSLIHPRARTQDRVIRCHRYPLKTCHTGTLPFAAEAGAIPAVAGRLAVPAAAELPDAGGGAWPLARDGFSAERSAGACCGFRSGLKRPTDDHSNHTRHAAATGLSDLPPN